MKIINYSASFTCTRICISRLEKNECDVLCTYGTFASRS